jgi:hypothetical protein
MVPQHRDVFIPGELAKPLLRPIQQQHVSGGERHVSHRSPAVLIFQNLERIDLPMSADVGNTEASARVSDLSSGAYRRSARSPMLRKALHPQDLIEAARDDEVIFLGEDLLRVG